MGDLSAPGIRFADEGMNWVVRPDRVSIETTNRDVNCGERLARVAENLSWTPIVALGMNVAFRGEPSAGASGALKLQQIEDAVQCSCHAGFEFQGGILNVQLSRTVEYQELSLNAHFDISVGRTDPDALSKTVVKRCDEFLSIRKEMLDFASKLTNIEINNAEHITK